MDADILDVGGASGVYATWLTGEGHHMRLVDPVPRHVDSVRAKGVDAVIGDARELDEPDGGRDAVLLGPLYHLVDRADRVRALAEARARHARSLFDVPDLGAGRHRHHLAPARRGAQVIH